MAPLSMFFTRLTSSLLNFCGITHCGLFLRVLSIAVLPLLIQYPILLFWGVLRAFPRRPE
jgi:hypothetical protein